MTAAVIDLGTNTFHLIIAELTEADPIIQFKTNVPVKLGEGKINENVIIPEAFDRGISTLKGFRVEIDKHHVTVIKAIGTSALRSANNGRDFVEAAKNQANIEINIIDGDQEADYIFQGVKATGLIDCTALIIDIGGGSTEFVLCNPKGVLWKKSYNLGAARLQQAYFKTDPISVENQNEILRRLQTELTDLKAICELHKPSKLIGSAGAFETFATMIHPDDFEDSSKSMSIDIKKYLNLSYQLISSSHEQRKNFEGLIKLRVDMIVIASLITNHVLQMINPENLSVSTYDLKMGVLASLKPLDT